MFVDLHENGKLPVAKTLQELLEHLEETCALPAGTVSLEFRHVTRQGQTLYFSVVLLVRYV